MGLFAEWQPRYAEHRIPTFPVTPDKKPGISNYQKIGTRVSSQIALRFPDHDAFGVGCKISRLTILDVDTNDERVLADGLDEFGPTPFIVRSGSGNFQAWYRNNGETRKVRPDPQRPIDILGDGFVVAPPSIGRKGQYQIISGTLDDLENLPRMKGSKIDPKNQHDTHSSSSHPHRGLREGQGRNNSLLRPALRSAHHATTLEELIQMVSHANQQFAEPLPADEVLSVSKSAWKYKEAGRLMAPGGEATAVVFQSDADHLWDQPKALSLLIRLRMKNGFRNGAPFPLAQGMAKSMGMSIPTYRAARDVLVDRFFLEIVHPGGNGPNDPAMVRLL